MKSISLLRSRALLTRNTLTFSSESCVLDRLERARNSRREIAGDSLVPVERGDASGRRRARSAGGQKGRGSRGQAPRPAGAATPASHWRPALRGHLCPVLATQGAGSRSAGRVFLRIFEGQGTWQKVIARPLQATPGRAPSAGGGVSWHRWGTVPAPRLASAEPDGEARSRSAGDGRTRGTPTPLPLGRRRGLQQDVEPRLARGPGVRVKISPPLPGAFTPPPGLSR